MNKIISLFIFLASFGIAQAQDNEIYVDQSGATANIDFEQLGAFYDRVVEASKEAN